MSALLSLVKGLAIPIKAHTLLPATLTSKDPFTAGLTSTTSAPLIPTSLKALTTLTDRVLKHPQLVHRSIVTSAEPAVAGAALDTPLADTLGAPPFFADPFFATIPRQFPSTHPAHCCVGDIATARKKRRPGASGEDFCP